MENYPAALQVALRNFYVDDLLSGSDSTEQAMQTQKEMKELFTKGVFDLRKWTSNNIEFLKSVPEKDREIQPHEFDKIDGVKTPGLKWKNHGDVFC